LLLEAQNAPLRLRLDAQASQRPELKTLIELPDLELHEIDQVAAEFGVLATMAGADLALGAENDPLVKGEGGGLIG
jgi:hypothetical protein